MLIRHPDMFYVSLKGDRDSVFLREAYRDSQLIEKDRMLLIKEKLRALVNVPRFPRRNAPRTESDEAEGKETEDRSGEDEEDEWSDIENLGSDEYDDDEDFEDEWDDDDDDVPPDFSDEDDALPSLELSRPSEHVNGSTKNEEKILAPVFPDGRPRERW
ncbi:UNVERIFIED_CONTAM: protein WHAT'S THIS FACTOR 1, chloroplastic [Sesamum radiatum]|uniref:Protein WHAT'S THIS FACTOR 1, chloroplastic n=1 Tax=Sesamum radiatum TaxID=300843 RepID=A0AAW2VHE3_SESRA